MQTWTYPSKSGGTPHTTTLHDDGLFTCTCKGYYIKRLNKPRQCSHIEDVVKKLGLHTVQRGEAVYSAGQGEISEKMAAKGAAALAEKAEGVNENAFEVATAQGYINPQLAIALPIKYPPTLSPSERNEAMWKHITTSYLTGYVWETKWDGQRSMVAVEQGRSARAWSRPQHGEGVLGHPRPLAAHLVEHLKALPTGTYDTEEMVPGGRSWDVANLANKDKKVLAIFDMPICMGKNLCNVPLVDRRELLETILRLANSPFLQFSAAFTPGRAGVEEIWRQGGEGAMIKRADSIYRPGWRGPAWIKLKLWDYEPATLLQFIPAKEGSYATMEFQFDDGVTSKCKTLGHLWLKEFAKNGPQYIGKRFIVKYTGRTDDERKPRHPQFDHFCGEGE